VQNLHSAAIFWQQGRFQEAAAACRAFLQQRPENVDALNLLAAACAQLGRHAEAVDALTRAISLRPKDAVLRNNLGNALRAAGETERALECYRHALRLQPSYLDAHYNAGVALQAIGQLVEAEEAYRHALALDPAHVASLYNLGNALRATGRPREAEASYRRALTQSPQLVQALNNLGTLLQEEGQGAEAIACYRRALEIQPGFSEAHHSLGGAHMESGRATEAMQSFQRAIALNSSNAEAHYRMGNALRTLGRMDEAIASYSRALEIRPGLAAAAGERVYTMLRCCDWANLPERIEELHALVDAGETISPFVMMHVSDDPSLLQRCARLYARTKSVDAKPLWNGECYNHERIRIAYLSADFRDHPVGTSIVELLEAQDRRQFEVVVVSFTRAPGDTIAERCRAAADRYLDAQDLHHSEVAAWLRSAEVDIAVDLMGYTARNRQRVLAYRPTPVAVGYLGYPGTLGAPWINYLVADLSVIPTCDAHHYDEEILRLPGTFMPTDTTLHPSLARPRSAEHLPEDAFVFCCFNHPAKITPAIFGAWMRLLQQVDGSVLWLQAGVATTQRRLQSEAASRGVDPARLIFAPRTKSRADYLSRLGLADLFLDTHPYNAHSTARDALWAGLPVITRAGSSFASRVGASLVQASGLSQMVTNSQPEYEALAIHLGRNPDVLRAARERLSARLRARDLFRTEDLHTGLESRYRDIVDRLGA